VNARVDALDHFGDTALLYAAGQGSLDILQSFLAGLMTSGDIESQGTPTPEYSQFPLNKTVAISVAELPLESVTVSKKV